MTNLIPAEFHGLSVDILDHAGKKWLTAEQIGRALGYDESNARKGVLKLYERHGDEFTEADTFVVTLTTNSRGNPTTRIFSDTGCIKLGFLANTARAKDFRSWAAKVLAGQRDRQIVPTSRHPLRGGRAVVTRALEREVLERFVAGLRGADIARELRISQATVSLMIHGKQQFSPAAGQPECSPELIAAVAARHLEIEQARIVDAQQRLAQRLRNTANNQPLANTLDRVGQHLQQAPALALLPLESEGGAA